LLLSADAQRNAGEKVQETRRILHHLRKQPVDVVADYLKCLWTHTITILEEKRLSRRILDNLVFRVVMTVPAAWDHCAQDLMREAATRAGIRAPRAIGQTTVQLIAEPEAAALAAFDDAGLQWQPDLEVLPPHMDVMGKSNLAIAGRRFRGMRCRWRNRGKSLVETP
jgi:molecular chaperone DnaK (HSP70)